MCTLITSSAWRNNQGAAVGGVGIVVYTQIRKTQINPRILKITFNGNPGTIVVVNYLPTEGNEAAREHYEIRKIIKILS